MIRRYILPTLVIATGVLSGCDPAPSTKLAPDQPMPDTSKMSQEEINKLHNQPSGSDAGRAGGDPVANHATGNTPPDRMGGSGG